MVSKIALALLLMVATVDAQRICSNPSCAMCARLESQYYARQTFKYQPQWTTVQPTVVVPPAAGYVKGTFGPTKNEAIPSLLVALDLTPYDTLVDIGCGDARILIAAARTVGCVCRGYEIQPLVAATARRKVREAGLESSITIIEGDSTKIADLEGCVVFSYMWESVTDRMAPELAKAKRIVSNHHKLPATLSAKRYQLTRDPAMGHCYIYERVQRWPTLK